MAGKYGSKDVTISLADAPGGTPRQIKDFVMELGGAKIVVELQSSEAFGDLWKEYTPTGQRSSPAIPISGNFDTTATTGPHVVFMPTASDADPNSVGRALVLVFGDAKTFTVTVHLNDYEVQGNNGKLTSFTATIQPTGAAVWS